MKLDSAMGLNLEGIRDGNIHEAVVRGEPALAVNELSIPRSEERATQGRSAAGG
ncbi:MULTISPECIES: hypothetical protein [unclassified Streptomyces]|uniref:hypothetical protein n=1 Tax=unclassified Streptomyces TaxID=2593676 RepID=UPI0013A6D2D2|nr:MULTISPECIES: hypothetical protein [unclassified Streptomyces]